MGRLNLHKLLVLFIICPISSGWVYADSHEEFIGCLGLGAAESMSAIRRSAPDFGGSSTLNTNLVEEKLQRLAKEFGISPPPRIVYTENEEIVVAPNCKEKNKVGVLFLDSDLTETLLKTSDLSLDVVLAHELAHILQFRLSSTLHESICITKKISGVKPYELLADLASGHAMRTLYATDNPTELILTVSTLADYEFSNEEHHGIVNERINAFNLGQMLTENNKPIDMQRLLRNKTIFMESLGGPNLYGATPNTMQRYYSNIIRRLYQ